MKGRTQIMDRKVFRLLELPIELTERILSYVSYPYLLMLLTMPELGNVICMDYYKMLNDAHLRMIRYYVYRQEAIEYVPGHDMITCYRDNTISLMADHELSTISLISTSRDGANTHRWIFDTGGYVPYKLLYAEHRLHRQLHGIVTYATDLFDCGNTLRALYWEGRLLRFRFGHEENLIDPILTEGTPRLWGRVITFCDGRTWSVKLDRGTDTILLARQIVGEAGLERHPVFSSVALIMRRPRKGSMVPWAGNFLPTFPLILLQAIERGTYYPYFAAHHALASEPAKSELSALFDYLEKEAPRDESWRLGITPSLFNMPMFPMHWEERLDAALAYEGMPVLEPRRPRPNEVATEGVDD